MAHIVPFHFDRLPKLSERDVRILGSLLELLPRIGFADELRQSLSGLLTEKIGLPFSFDLQKITTGPAPEVLRALPREGIYLVFGLAPFQERAFLEVDSFLAHSAIDKLLGGTGSPSASSRTLTEIEEGVLSYLFLKILSEIYERCGENARVHFRLEGFQKTSQEVSSLMAPKEGVVLMTLRLTLGNHSGYARLALPSAFLEKAFLEAGAQAGSSSKEKSYFEARLQNLSFLQTELRAEIGRTMLRAGDLQGIEPGDVVLLEQTSAHLQGKSLEGRLSLRVGRGERGGFQAQILPGPEKIQLQVEGMERK